MCPPRRIRAKTFKTLTPDPWEFRYYHSAGCSILVSKHPRPGSASVRDPLKGVRVTTELMVYDDQSNVDQLSPDARLLTAAPDLLRALRRLTGAVTKGRKRLRKPATGAQGQQDDLATALAVSRAALSKATVSRRPRHPFSDRSELKHATTG